MKIITIVRTRDEERNVERFCTAYQEIADKILVADGGSEDNTIDIARSFPNVEVRNFTERTELANGYWRNNDSDHINFLIAWAKEYEPDWIIMDDCDSSPNYLLRQDGRQILTETECNMVMAVRIYLWGTEEHFPHMADSGLDEYQPSLWAWRPRIDLWTVTAGAAYTLKMGDEILLDDTANPRGFTSVLDLMPPLCLLHYSWDDLDRVKQKVKVYRESGLIPKQQHPLEFAGDLEPLPEWAHE